VKIEVILPVAQYDMALSVLEKIDQNTTTPSDVHVIDNSADYDRLWPNSDKFHLDVLRSTTGRLNESWEVARAKLDRDTDYVTFLNDDIIIGDWFFQRVVNTFSIDGSIGIVVPHLVTKPEEVIEGAVSYNQPPHWVLEASAFTIKKSILDKIPPVPWKRITTFYGDNWMWAHTRRQGYCVMQDTGNNMYHHVGVTVRERGFRSIKKKEFNEWALIKKEVWGI